jgi:hypothetical protein
MNKKEVEAIVKDTLEFVEEEFFETTAGEKKDLAKFLRERLAAQPGVQADGLQVLECAECGEQTSMNHKESCSKRPAPNANR